MTIDGASYAINTTYDALDRLASATLPNGEVVTYEYGDHGLPVRLRSAVLGDIASAAAYNELGRPYDVTLGNGLVVSYRYHGIDYRPLGSENLHYGMLRGLVAGTRQDPTYYYDNRGNVTRVVDGRVSETIDYTYDDLDRLLSASSALFGEAYAYYTIGTLTSQAGVTHHFPAAGQLRPHAPDWVGNSGNTYGYDDNGNLTGAEGRTYEYDVENRLTVVREGGSEIKAFTYDGNGGLHTVAESGTVSRHYVAPEYEVNPATSEVIIHYHLGGKRIATATNGGPRYLLTDHLSSTHGEAAADQSELRQRRYYPFGSDRAVSGASDLSAAACYTSQRRADAGNAAQELYHYGARWYLPGVGIFTQTDTIVPEYKNPQAPNRYAYLYVAP